MHQLSISLILALLCAGCGSGSGSLTPGSAPVTSSKAGSVTPAFSGTADLQSGWNAVGMRGLPVTSLSSSNIAGFAYWDGAAYQTSSMSLAALNDNGGSRRGLWVFATAPGSITYSADDPSAVATDLRAGWNLLAFPAPAPFPGSSLVARVDGQVVPTGNVVLTQFSEINQDNTYKTVDVGAGGTLVPGKAYWVFAARALNLSYGASPTGPLVSTDIGMFETQSMFAISNDGRFISANQLYFAFPGSPARVIGLHKDLQTETVTDNQFHNDVPSNTGGGGGPSAADGSLDLCRGEDLDSGHFLAIYTRSSNSNSLEYRTAQRISGEAISGSGNLLSWTERTPEGVSDVFTKPRGSGVAVGLKQRFAALASRNLATEVFTLGPQGQGSMSDDGSMLFVASTSSDASGPEDLHHLRINVNSGAATDAFVGNTESHKKMSGDGRFALYHTLNGGFGNHVLVYVRTIGGGSADDLVSQSSAGQTANEYSYAESISSDGRFVLFVSAATNLVASDTNGGPDTFLRDRLNRTTVRVSVDASGNPLPFGGGTGLMSRNGQWIVMQSAEGSGHRWIRVRNPAL